MKASNRPALLGAKLFFLLGSLEVAVAQTVITSITTSFSAGSPQTINLSVAGSPTSFTFRGDTLAVTSFTAGSTTYAVSGTADYAFVRRNNSSVNQSSIWYASSPSGGFHARYETTYESALLGNNLYRGSDNTFANNANATASPSDGNIERIDFAYAAPMAANAAMGFAVFDRGAANVHDAFKIALITGWDYGSNRPTAYSTLASRSANWPSAVNYTPPGNMDYTLFRYGAVNGAGALPSPNDASEVGSQGVGGVVFDLTSFGVAPGTPVYGYSLFGYDVTDGGSSANLIDWTNSVYFPTNTNGATGGGGIDLAAANGITFTDTSFSIIPEPGSFAIFGALSLALGSALRRRPRA
jgi:hypothetical protein